MHYDKSTQLATSLSVHMRSMNKFVTSARTDPSRDSTSRRKTPSSAWSRHFEILNVREWNAYDVHALYEACFFNLNQGLDILSGNFKVECMNAFFSRVRSQSGLSVNFKA